MIVLLSGYAGSGKDTCGEYLCANYGFKRYAVADVMKEKVSKVFGIPMEVLNTQDGKASLFRDPATGKTSIVRDIIINFAMAKRAIDPDYWINAMISAIHDNGDDHSNVVVTDFRFPNELSRLQESFPDKHVVSIRIKRMDKGLVDSQCSENVLDSFTFDHVIDNGGDIAFLQYQVDDLLTQLL